MQTITSALNARLRRIIDHVSIVAIGDRVTGLEVREDDHGYVFKASTNKGFIYTFTQHLGTFWTVQHSDIADMRILTTKDCQLLEQIAHAIELVSSPA